MSSNAWIGLIVLAGMIAIIWFFIRGTLQIASRDKSDEDDAGVGYLEGIDEDENKKKRK